MSAATSAPPALSHQQRVFTMVAALLGLLLAALDQTIVATAGPQIQKELDIPASLYVWITTAYLVASTVLVPIYGKLSDRYGRKNILLIGISIFLAGSFFCGISQTALQLILSRAVQGAGSASLFTTAFAVVADLFPPTERGKYQGLFGAVFGLSSVLGPLVGGLITDHPRLGWHWAFFLNLPIGAIAISFIVTKMPPLRRGRASGPIDIAGAFALVISLVPLLLALSLGKSEGAVGRSGYDWGSWQILVMLSLFAIGLVAFLRLERRAEDPILDLSLFRNRTFAIGTLASFVVGGCFLSAIVFLPLFMVNVAGLSATSSGLTATPLTLGIVFGNIVVGQLVSRLGSYKPILVASLVLLTAAYAVLGLTLSITSTQGEVTLKMVLVGLGLGPSIPLFTLAIQNAVRPQQIGVATSMATFSRSMGSTIGIAVIGTIFANALGAAMHERMSAATAGLPAALRAQMPGGNEAGAGLAGGEEAASPAAFDAAAIKARISTSFEAQRALATAALRDRDPRALEELRQSPRLPGFIKEQLAPGLELSPRLFELALSRIDAAEQQALTGIDQLSLAFRGAFAEAIVKIFRTCIFIALLGLLVTLFLPAIPLRRTNDPAPISE